MDWMGHSVNIHSDTLPRASRGQPAQGGGGDAYLELDHLLDVGGPAVVAVMLLPHHVDKVVLALGEAAALGRAVGGVVVLAAQQAELERAEGGQADAEAAVQALELALDLGARQEVVLRLLDDGGDQAELLGDAAGLGDLVRAPLRRAPVHGPALGLDDVVEGAHRLLHRREAVRPVRVDDVDVLEVHALERVPETLDDVLPRQAVVVDQDLAVRAAVVDLGADDDVVAVPAELLDGLAHGDFRLATGIAITIETLCQCDIPRESGWVLQFSGGLIQECAILFGGIKEVDAKVVGLLQAGSRALCCRWFLWSVFAACITGPAPAGDPEEVFQRSYRAHSAHRICAKVKSSQPISYSEANGAQLDRGRGTNVIQPPRPSTDTWSPELPRRRYCMPVFLGSSNAIFV